LRNKTINENIVNIVQKNSNKRIIVLTGFKHRYSILKSLEANNQSKDILELIEVYSVYKKSD
jgi:pheromone shutdown protein TraB